MAAATDELNAGVAIMPIEQVIRVYETALSANDTPIILDLYGAKPVLMPQRPGALECSPPAPKATRAATSFSCFAARAAPDAFIATSSQPVSRAAKGYMVKQVKPDVYVITDGIYQSAFVTTGKGVIPFDAPESLAQHIVINED